MGPDFNEIKDILNDWLTAHLKETMAYKADKDSVIHINRSVLLLENWLMKWRKENGLNERIDAGIISNNILENISDASSTKAFQAKDYQFNFLYFLARKVTDNEELFELINLFIEKFKKQFSFADIIITKSGATRCRTNIRFALDMLRNMGLVLSKDLNDKRSLSPSILGMVALLNIEYQKSSFHFDSLGNEDSFIEKDEDHLRPFRKINKYVGYQYDGTLFHSLKMFSNKTYLYQFLNWLRDITPSEEEKGFLENILEQYINFTNEAILITKDGLKLTKEFDKLAGNFQDNLFENHKRNIPFMNKLIAHLNDIREANSLS